MTRQPVRLTFATLLLTLLPILSMAQTAQSDAAKIEEETMHHFQAILRLDTSNPPGNEKLVVDYLKSVLEREGIETKVFALDPQMWVPEEKLYVRVEDTVVITENGVENLTPQAPLELDEVEALIKKGGGMLQQFPALGV